jgi:membrane associated rhomboid family serine protease
VSDDSEQNNPLGAPLGQFSKLADVRERGLVLSAAGITHAIAREGKVWILWVDLADVPAASAEIAAYDAELAERVVFETGEVPARVSFWSVPLVAAFIVGFAGAQAELGNVWVEAGILSSEAVVGRSEWWRVFTALTLHGDVPHVLANLAAGLVFGALLFPAFGQGLAWLLVLFTGALGNAVSVWTHFPQPYRSLGASTAVFGALGLLVGDALWRLLRHRSGRSWWAWVLPLGAGVALLAFLGAGEGKVNVDVLAHLWGFATGAPIGAAISALRPNPKHLALQMMCGLCAMCVLALVWGFAWVYGAS